MTDTTDKKEEMSPPVKKASGPGPLMILVPALLAGGAAFGGAKMSHAVVLAPTAEHAAAAPPGPTVALEPFLVVTQDANKKAHAMKVTLAVEFDDKAKEETLKSFTPRIRDAMLSYLRTLPYEDALDTSKSDKLRGDLLERLRAVGATSAQRVLITDLVVQ